MLNRFKSGLGNAVSSVRGLRRNDKGVVMTEWVALAGIFVAVLITTFLAIGDKADVVVSEVDNQLGVVTSDIGGGGTGTAT